MMIRSERRHGLWILVAGVLVLAMLATVGIVLALRQTQPHSTAGIHYVRDDLPAQGGVLHGL